MQNELIKEYIRIQNDLFAKVSLENDFKIEKVIDVMVSNPNQI